MDDGLILMADLHRRASRQGPGSDAMTRRAIDLAGLPAGTTLDIADIGCGTGASALVLASELDAHVIAMDFLADFIHELSIRTASQNLADKVTPLVGNMQELPFEEGEFDVIWSEGAIYCMGFEQGATEWARFLRPGGVLVVSEITWTTQSRPAELQRYWDAAYPRIDTAAGKLAVLENCGYSPLGYFTLPPECWLENYYRPLEASFDDFLARHDNSEAAQAIVAMEREEIALYEKYRDYYSYGMYIARYGVNPTA